MDIRKLPAALTKGFMAFAVLMVAAALLVHLASYGPDAIGPTLMSLALLLFPIVFLVFVPAVVVLSFARISIDRMLAGLPVYAYVVGGLVFTYVFVNFFLMIPLLPGQPEQVGPNFYFDDHGALSPITHDAYLMGLMHTARLFSGHELVFLGFAALIAYQVDRIRAGRIMVGTAPRDDAVERSPLPYPLARVVALRTALSPETCADRLLAATARPAWALFATSQGLRGQASATEFRVEGGGQQSQLVYAVGQFGRVGGATGIRVLLTFKRWPLILIAISIVSAPVIFALMVAVAGVSLPWQLLAIVLAFGVGGNFIFGLDQRRRLLAEIKRRIEATEIPPTDPQSALLNPQL